LHFGAERTSLSHWHESCRSNKLGPGPPVSGALKAF
jgi:hypothetical protein